MITPSEHAALTWAVDLAEQHLNVNERFYPPNNLAALRGHIYEARRFLAREVPTAEEVRS